MTDTLWSDISEWQTPVNDAYPHDFLCIRSNDGTHLDTHFDQNIAWCRAAVATGKLWGFMVYYFYRPGVDGAGILRSRVGSPDPRLTVMIDVENAGGQVGGDQSAAINAQHDALAAWLGDPRRVVGYGNVIDLNNLWPHKPAIRFVIAAYGSNPGYPGRFAHQFADNQNVPPFGPSDFNSADGMAPADLQAMFGFGSTPAPTPLPTPPAPAPSPPAPAPVDPAHRNVYTPLKLDGVPTLAQMQTMTVIYQTVKALQFVIFGGNVADCDGKFGPASAKALQAHVGVPQDGVIGPQTVRAVQAKVGAAVDGQWGPQTTYSLQNALNHGSF